MKNFGKLFACGIAAAILSGCTVVTPGPGEEAVLLSRPYVFGDGGIDPVPVRGPDRDVTWLSTSYVLVNMTPQVDEVRFDDLASSDSFLLDFSTNIQYKINDSPRIVGEFGADWMKNNVRNAYTAIVRNEVKKHTMQEIMSDSKIAQDIDTAVTEEIRKIVEENKIPVSIMNVTLGRARPNDEIIAQINTTGAQKQRELTMIAAVRAENERKNEQEAKAAADNAYRIALGLSSEQYLQREIAEMYTQACREAKSCVMASPGTSVIVQ